jgi:hypothetical protein
MMCCAQGVGISLSATRGFSWLLTMLSQTGGSSSTLGRRSLIRDRSAMEQPSALHTPKSVQKSTSAPLCVQPVDNSAKAGPSDYQPCRPTRSARLANWSHWRAKSSNWRFISGSLAAAAMAAAVRAFAVLICFDKPPRGLSHCRTATIYSVSLPNICPQIKRGQPGRKGASTRASVRSAPETRAGAPF